MVFYALKNTNVAHGQQIEGESGLQYPVFNLTTTIQLI